MSIVDAFNHYFEMIPATSDTLKQEVYKIRHQVYCVERAFLDVRDDGLDIDEYDERSSHYLIRYRNNGSYMATTRLILPDRQDPERLFSIENLSQIDKTLLPKNIDRCHLAELSRFCVSKNFRRRANEQGLIVTNDTDDSSRRAQGDSAHLTLSLFACAMRISAEQDIRYWYAIMEPALKRVFSGLGIYFVQIGLPVDFHGVRVPCFIKLDTMLNNVAEKNPAYWDMITHYGDYQIKN
jgi:N-acyl amino acid synthase of PEP-CTERM/exosortase system